jgi:hypothetical protein
VSQEIIYKYPSDEEEENNRLVTSDDIELLSAQYSLWNN